MLDHNDLKSIGEIVQKEVQSVRVELKKDMREMKEEIIVAVGEVIEQQILPQISALDEKVEKLDQRVEKLDNRVENLNKRVEGLDSRVEKLDSKVEKLPTKDEISDKLSDLRGDLVIKAQRVDQKVEALADLGRERSVFTDADIKNFKQTFNVFPQRAA